MSALLPPPEWNHTERTYPDTLLPGLLSAQARRTPDSPALRFGDEALTYAELDAQVAALAERLAALHAGRGSLVAVCMERSLEMVVALHAILRAGGAYVPVDPEYPDERIGFMLDDLDEPLLLTQPGLAERLGAFAARVVPVELAADPEPAPDALPAIEPDDLAYVIYTSGSTGRPKGAMITHGAIANRIHWMQEYLGLTAQDRVLQKTPFSFDVSVWEFFWPLAFGAELVVAEPGGHRDSAYLVRTIVEQGITTIHFVPSMLQLFLEDPGAGDCTDLRRVICSGEALPRALQDRFFSRLGAELHNLYGPTEAAVDVSAWACDPASELPFVPIGRPVANTQLHILDEELRPVPVGTVGELHIGGVQVGRGYLNRPELTAERFIADPFRQGGMLYRTGDLARYLPDGAIEFLGRADFQVKIRGFRVELGEIEAAIEAYDGVRGSVVVAHARADGETELVAYVAHPAADDLPLIELRHHLAGSLPEYMIPARYIGVERFPLSANGKVDRKALPAPGRVRPLLGVPFVAPRTRLEHLIAERWQGLLDLDAVGIHDRFFELGGTSLGAARFINRLQADLGETLPMTSLFSAPSVAEYAAFLEGRHPAAVARLLGRELVRPETEPDADRDHASRTASGTPVVYPSSASRSTVTPRRSALDGQRQRRRAARAGSDR